MKKLILLLLLSAYAITVFLKPADILSDQPIYTDDYSMHYAQCLSTKRFLTSSGSCWGYDPFFLAGFPQGALVNADNKAWELFFFALSPLSEGIAFKAYLILFLLTYPLLLYAAARNFGLPQGTALIASSLGILFFHLSFTIDCISWGMVSYVFMSYASIYVFSLFYKLFEHFTLARYLVLSLLASLMLLMHILSPFHLFIPLCILYALSARKLSPSRHALLATMVFIVLIINSFWLMPLTRFFQDKTTRPENYNFTLQITSPAEPLSVYLQQKQSVLHRKVDQLNTTFMDVMLLLFGACGFYLWGKERRMRLLLPFLAEGIFLFAVAYYGSRTDFFAQLQPQRFTIPLNLFLIIPASAGLQSCFQELFHGRSIAARCLILSLSAALLVGPVARPLKTIFNYDLYRLSCDFPPQLKDLLTWLENNTTREGRILLEDSESDTFHQYFGAHFPALFPEYVKREYLCGPRPLYPIKHSYASFTAGTLFEKPVGDYSLKDLQEEFNRYNVGWIVSWHEESKKVFERFPDYTVKAGEIGGFTLYRVMRTPSFFLKGSGAVQSDYNRLALDRITAEQGEIIISYHFMEGLKTEPERLIERVFMGDDPVGFIRILNPPRSLVVYNGY